VLTENTKVSVGIATVISLALGIAACGVTWGIYSARLEALEAQASDVVKDARQLEQKQIQVSAQFEEILRRLDRLDRKLDWYENRSQERDNRTR
jgi:hypothetical protein